jgi:hypothetical protein
MKAFDALFGLVAIALDDQAAAGPIVWELQSFRDTLLDRSWAYFNYFELAYNDAIRTISRPDLDDRIADVEVEGLHLLPQSILGLATPAALRMDPAHFSPSGQFVGFSMLPSSSRQCSRTTIPRRQRLAPAWMFQRTRLLISFVGRGFQQPIGRLART